MGARYGCQAPEIGALASGWPPLKLPSRKFTADTGVGNSRHGLAIGIALSVEPLELVEPLLGPWSMQEALDLSAGRTEIVAVSWAAGRFLPTFGPRAVFALFPQKALCTQEPVHGCTACVSVASGPGQALW